MKEVISIIILLSSFTLSHAQTVKVVKVDDLVKMYDKKNDTTYVINFWATWCKPCVEELPAFEQLHGYSLMSDTIPHKIKVIMVSLDFVEKLNTEVIPFLKKWNYHFPTVLLDETNANYFIPKIENEWSGAIPCTLIVNHDKKFRKFISEQITQDELYKIVTGIAH